MSVVNTNISASVAQSALVRNSRALSSAMEQLSTGKKNQLSWRQRRRLGHLFAYDLSNPRARRSNR